MAAYLVGEKQQQQQQQRERQGVVGFDTDAKVPMLNKMVLVEAKGEEGRVEDRRKGWLASLLDVVCLTQSCRHGSASISLVK